MIKIQTETQNVKVAGVVNEDTLVKIKDAIAATLKHTVAIYQVIARKDQTLVVEYFERGMLKQDIYK